MDSKKIVQDDILRYKKNKLAGMLTLLGLVFTMLYFALLYSVNNSFFYTINMGFSVIVTLVLLLVAFLSSESIKNYRKTYCIVLLVLAAINIGRIFYYPLRGLREDAFKDAVYFWTKMSSGGIFTFLLIYLVASAACYVGAAVIGFMYADRLEKHEKGVQSGEIDVEAAIAQEEEKAELAKATVAENAVAETAEAEAKEAETAEQEANPSEEEK